ncbi:MAG: hypothetical protein LBH61_06040 [Dysgonamonadaceae bacterium]|jgi:hypothetical protein|nr:hypothetical protein [Dysgonamonadaceae bacterium]
MDVLKVKLNELRAFCESDLYRSFPVKPISPLRVESYLSNPRAKAEDTVLFMFVEGEKLIAFRTVLPDSVISMDKVERFAWFSGVWVSPEYRGKKLSLELSTHVLAEWKNRMMVTNYTALSDRATISRSRFYKMLSREGMRFYLYPNLNRIYKDRENYWWSRFILPWMSLAVSIVSLLRVLFFAAFFPKRKYIEQDSLDDECRAYLRTFPDTVFNRREAELDWIFRYRWIMQSTAENTSYPFSYLKKRHSMRIVKMLENGVFAGFFIYTIIESRMKIIYYFMDDRLHPRMADIVSQIAAKRCIQYLTVLDPRLVPIFAKRNRCFSHTRIYTSHVYTSLHVFSKNIQLVFDGDGDNCFT